MPALSSATRSGKPRRSGGPGAGTTFRCVSGGAARSPAMRICASAPPHQSMATRPPPTTAARLRPGRYRPPPHSVLYVSLKVRLPGGYRSRYFPFPLARPPRSQKPGTALHRRLPKALRASDVCSKAQPRHRADTSHHLPRNKCRPQPGPPAPNDLPAAGAQVSAAAAPPSRRGAAGAAPPRARPTRRTRRTPRSPHLPQPAEAGGGHAPFALPIPAVPCSLPRPPAALFTSSGPGSSAEQRGQQQQAAGGGRHGSAER